MIINHNMASLNTYRQLSANNANSAKSLEKLSSGLRINKAGDDAAGLAISEKMRGQIRGLDQASRNGQDAISMIQTAEGSLNETQSILQRMRELATQSANDTNTDTDRNEIQKEMNQLSSEINRIGNTTEFNTQKLLKGTNAAAVTTDAAQTAITEGAAGVADGELSNLTVNAKSVVGVASTATVQASSADATGEVSKLTVTTSSVKGEKASVTIANGLTFEATDIGDGLNDKTIEIKQGTTAGAASSVSYSNGKYTFTIGQTAGGDSLATNRGELYNEIKASLDNSVDPEVAKITVKVPSNTEETLSDIATTGAFAGGKNQTAGEYTFSIDTAFKEAGDTITIGGKTFTGVIAATADASKGEFLIATDSATAPDRDAQAASLLAAIKADADLGARFDQTTSTATANEITLIEATGKATGVNLTNPTTAGAGADDKLTITNASGKNLGTVTIVQAGTNVGTAATTTDLGSGDFDGYVIEAGLVGTQLNGVTVSFEVSDSASANDLSSSWDEKTRTLKITGNIESTTADAATQSASLSSAIKAGLESAGFTQVGTLTTTDLDAKLSGNTTHAASITFGSGASVQDPDTMAVDENNGNLTIYLASDAASDNTAEKIQTAIQALGKIGGNDYSKYTVTSSGNWDTSTVGNNIVKGTSTLVGGTEEVKGDYSLSIDKAFSAGDVVVVKGQTFKAVESGAVASKGEFNIAGGDKNAQASGLIDAINLNAALKDGYTATATGSQIKITERTATGSDLKIADLKVTATGTSGEYAISADTLIKDGGSFSVDGVNISVSSKETHVGYADGTAIKEGATLADQTQALADAINKNQELGAKYSATVTDGKLVLTQKEGYQSSSAPDVKSTTSTKGDFNASFQVGANSGQSMTIEIADMRSAALGITGDGSVSTIAAKDGSVASYVSTANVTNGTTNENVEFALDVSSHEKATAAISVLNDAIEAVSAQRSELGAYQNRLEHTIANLGTSSENLTAAESRIRDVDMAKEMMNFQKNNILSQAAQAMLAQANQAPQGVLQLLR